MNIMDMDDNDFNADRYLQKLLQVRLFIALLFLNC